MKLVRKPRLGLAAVMCTPFRGDKEGNYRQDRQRLEELARRFNFELHTITQGIYTLEQAQTAARELKDWGADFIILQTSSFAAGEFIYPFVDLGIKLGLWAVPEGQPTAEGGLPLNSFTATNMYNSIIRTRRKDYPWPIKWFFGHVGQALFDRRLEISIQALRAAINLKGARIGLIGGVAPGFDNLIIDQSKLAQKLEINTTAISTADLIDKARQINLPSAAKKAAEIRETASSFDERQQVALEKSGRMSLALEHLSEELALDGLAISCWPKLQSDYQFAICSVMGHLNTNGLIAACEGDVTSAVSMLALHYLSDGEPVTLMDLAAIDPQDQSILLWHCGPTSPALADNKGTRMESLWLFDGPDGQTIGLHNDLVLRPGQATVLGLTTDFERMLIFDGFIDNSKPSYNGSRGWCTNLRLNGEGIHTMDLIETILASGYQHHYPLAYGDLAEASLELCTWLGVTPIQRQAYSAALK